MKVYFVDGKYVPIHENEINEYDEIIVGEIYKYENKYYMYYGKQEEQEKPGIYLNDDESNFVVVSYRKDNYTFNEDNIIDIEDNSDIFKINEAPHVEEEPEVEKPKKEPKEKIKRKSVNRERKYNRDDILFLEVKLEDSDMVRLIKEKLNERKITLDYIYKIEGNANGYNLFYGLQTRNNLRWDAFLKWCDILEVEPVLSLIDKKQQ
jgi:hypothetical protein